MAKNEQRIYRLNENRLRRSLIKGFTILENGVLSADEETLNRSCILTHIDSNLNDFPWGRLAMSTSIDGDIVFTVKAFASNEHVFNSHRGIIDIDSFLMDESIPLKTKFDFFTAAQATKISGHNDILLYEQTGRYIWLWFEVNGTGRCDIRDIKLLAPADTFLNTFPEVYRTNADFLRRYLSIFSTLHYDMEQKIENLPRIIDIDTAPADALPLLASWMGLKIADGFLTEEEQRRLLKNAYPLLKIKGTRRAIEGIVRLFVTEPFYIVERNMLSAAQLKGAETLYGSTPFDFSILINAASNNDLAAKLQMLIELFKPARSRANIVFLKDQSTLDGFTYIDINTTLGQNSEGTLDSGFALNGMTYLG